MTERSDTAPHCDLCSDTGYLLANQSPGLVQDGPCLCAQARQSATQIAEEQRKFKELIKSSMREVFHELLPGDKEE